MSLKNDAEEQAGKAKKLTELEKRLKKEWMELEIERRLVTELKKKRDREFVSKRNLEVIYIALTALHYLARGMLNWCFCTYGTQ